MTHFNTFQASVQNLLQTAGLMDHMRVVADGCGYETHVTRTPEINLILFYTLGKNDTLFALRVSCLARFA